MEEEKFRDEVDVHISDYVDFIKRRKVSLAASILLFAAAGYISSIFSPNAYKISAVIEPSSVECPKNAPPPPPYVCTTRLAVRLTRRRLNARANELLAELKPVIVTDRDEKHVFLELTSRGEENAGTGLRLMEELLQEIEKYYSGRVGREKARLSRLLEERAAEKEKTGALIQEAVTNPGNERLAPAISLLFSEILHLRSLFPEQNITGLESLLRGTHNIIILKEPHISETFEPRMGLSLAIGLISGIVLGIAVGAAKDLLDKKSSYKK